MMSGKASSHNFSCATAHTVLSLLGKPFPSEYEIQQTQAVHGINYSRRRSESINLSARD